MRKSAHHKSCTVKGCSDLHYGRGYCRRHYQQITRRGKLLTEKELAARARPKKPLPKGARRCTAKGCKEGHYSRDLCKKHYAQVLRHGRLTPESERGEQGGSPCPAPGCDRLVAFHGHCRRHALQIRAHGRLTPEREHLLGGEGCRIAGCKNKYSAKGLCLDHYRKARWQRLKAERLAGGRGAKKKKGKKARA